MKPIRAQLLAICLLPGILGCLHYRSAPPHRVTRLTHTGARNGQAMWSPDGDHIAFVSNRDQGWQIWRMAAGEGAGPGDPERLSSAEGPVGWPSWSKDGSRIFYYEQLAGSYRLRSLDLASGQVNSITAVGFDSFRPLPSPDGRSLLFDAVDPAEGNHNLYVLDLSTSTPRQLTFGADYDSDARWSPDGEEIVFQSDRGAGEYQTQIFSMAADGTSLRQLTQGPTVHGYPSWSPNGECIVYTAEEDGNRDLWVMDRSGSWKHRLTTHPGFDGDPVWDPRGGRILFTTDRFGGQELALLEVETPIARRCED